ncbi:hypothetical protein AAHC03_01275 [Spirometra sp. Aus1]
MQRCHTPSKVLNGWLSVPLATQHSDPPGQLRVGTELSGATPPSRPYSAGSGYKRTTPLLRTSDSGLGQTSVTATTATIGSISQLSPPLPVYSWEQEAISSGSPLHRKMTGGKRVTGSLDRLSRSAFELDIPDMRNTREGRMRNKRDMHELNERLAEQVERMRYLSAHNKQLSDEISSLKTRLLGETENLRETYEKEMRQLRQMLDEAEREKADSLARLLSTQQTNRNQADQINRLQAENDKVSRKLEQAFDDMNKRDGDLAMLQRRLEAMDEELAKDRQASDRMKRENESLMQQLNEETANRISGQSEMQTLKEEIEFLRRVHQQELSEMHRTLEEVGRGVDREIWQSEMSQAIRDIQDRYDAQLEKLRTDMDDMYNARLRELAKSTPDHKAEINALKAENQKLRSNSDNLRDQMSQLQSKNTYLEASMYEVSNEASELRRRIDFELAEAAKEREAAEEALARAHNEMSALMDVKLNLEAEIAAYRRLLETQDGIITAASGKSSPDLRRSRDSYQHYYSRPRISSLSPQRRSDDRSVPMPVTDIAHRFPERSDPSGSSLRSRLIEVDGEGDQQLSCNYKLDPKNMRAELTARTQFDKSYKGNISIDECSPDGRFVVITNNGNNVENLDGWRIVRNVEHGKQIIRYTFGDTPMLPKSSRKIWARGQRGMDASSSDLESPCPTWGVGSYIYTTLFTMNGEERATHAQRSEFNVN